MQHSSMSSQRNIRLRRIVLFGTPLLLTVLEFGHPLLDHEHTIIMLSPIAGWWVVLHVLLVPLFALMGWSFFLLIEGIQSPAATLCRYATVIYISFSIGYDTAVGLNAGVFVSNALGLPFAQQAVVQHAMTEMFSSNPIVISYYILFLSGVVAICSMVWALLRAGLPVLPALVLLGTVTSAYSHALPFGPFGSICFLLAALWIELVWRKAAQKERVEAEMVTTV